MKKVCIFFLLAMLLCSCAAEETFETVSDELIQPVMATPRQISVKLPDEAVAPVLESDEEQIYLCEDYEIILETLDSGDLNATVRHISGYDKENLTVIKTGMDGVDRYEFVWVFAGEEGSRLGRAVILDDGSYHYCMSVMRSAEETEESQIVWNDVFGSFSLT